MQATLVYPKWKKLEGQTEFHLPPHGPVVFAATVPSEVELVFFDDNRQEIDFDRAADIAFISVMLSCQLPRAFEIAAEFRRRGVPVLFGGIAVMLHSDEVMQHADSIFLGESEGRMEAVIADLKKGALKPRYDYMGNPPAIELVGTARREILNRELYDYRGVQMVDLIHASRGCKFDCFPCCTGFLGGKVFRPRPIDMVMAELEAIENNRLFLVDNSLAQDRQWLIDLFTEMIPLKKKFVSHPILDDDKVLDLAAQAGSWYVYQAVFDTSDHIREKIKRYRDHGIAVEATVILGTDDQDEDYIKRLVEFLIEVKLDVAEFTIMTPFPHSPVRAQMEREGRILTNDWSKYSADRVVFQPKQMTPEKLQELFHWSWDAFYADGGYQLKMGELFRRVIEREIADGTYRRYNPRKKRSFKDGSVAGAA
jgi:radical SAM superfamily enzyme YgiQ (UPF0313 family)